MEISPFSDSMESVIKSHRGRCGENGPQTRRICVRIPTAGCKRKSQRTTSVPRHEDKGLWPLSYYLRNPFGAVDKKEIFCVTRLGKTASVLPLLSRLKNLPFVLQWPSWDLISASLYPGLSNFPRFSHEED